MKIDQDLRIAIRSVVNARKNNSTWEEQAKQRRKSIADLLSRKKHNQKAKIAKQRLKKAEQLKDAAESFYNSLGLYSHNDSSIRDDEKFITAGGLMPDEPKKQSFDEIMASIARADNKQGIKILNALGIIWNGVASNPKE